MLLLLIFFAYILLAKCFCNSNKGIWINVVNNIKETNTGSKKTINIIILILFLLFPIILLQSKFMKFKNLIFKKDKVCSKDIGNFIKTYYPELYENLGISTIILHKKDIIIFIYKVMELFNKNIAEQESFKMEKSMNRLINGEKEKFIFSLNYMESSYTLVIELECKDKDNKTYILIFYAKPFLLKEIDENIIEFCLNH